ncbi:hypothetical protein R3P38DRAFT_3615689 [Favolaschia claudopus]|uniref:Uncharacterized protein n=1 Tax=Favolaschia claudopus TaxID=2862362 RepID=A0AAW0A4I9_9AGAR
MTMRMSRSGCIYFLDDYVQHSIRRKAYASHHIASDLSNLQPQIGEVPGKMIDVMFPAAMECKFISSPLPPTCITGRCAVGLAKLVTSPRLQPPSRFDHVCLLPAPHQLVPANSPLPTTTVINLPSPATTHRYCIETLYKGPMDDESANAVRDFLYISKMVPTSDKGLFYAFGRVFADTVRYGLRSGKKEDLFLKSSNLWF